MTEETKTTAEVTNFSFTEKRLSELKEQYSTVPDCTTKEGYNATRLAIGDLVKCRTSLDAKRKELKAPHIAANKQIDDEAKRITAELLALETPLKSAKKAADDEKARIKAEKEKAEADRLQWIRETVNAITTAPNKCAFKTPGEITVAIQFVKDMEILEEKYNEFTAEALQAQDKALEAMSELLNRAQKKEEEEKAAQAEREKLAAQRAEMEAERAELEKMKRETEAAQEKLKAEQREKERLEQAELEKKKTDARLKAEAQEARQRQEDHNKAQEEAIKRREENRAIAIDLIQSALESFTETEADAQDLTDAIINNQIPYVTFTPEKEV